MLSNSVDICEYSYEDLLQKEMVLITGLCETENFVSKPYKTKIALRTDRKLAEDEQNRKKVQARYTLYTFLAFLKMAY